MKIRISIIRTWSRPRESLHILLKINSFLMFHPSRILRRCCMVFGYKIQRPSYFMRVAQIKEQLKVVEEKVEEREIFRNTLNGLLRSWDSFIQGIHSRKKLITFNRLWEECPQEEARLITREEKMG